MLRWHSTKTEPPYVGQFCMGRTSDIDNDFCCECYYSPSGEFVTRFIRRMDLCIMDLAYYIPLSELSNLPPFGEMK